MNTPLICACADPCLLLTLGDPNGLGPELVCSVLSRPLARARILVLGPEISLRHHLSLQGGSRFWQILDDPTCLAEQPPGVYVHVPQELGIFSLTPGQTVLEGGRAAGICLDLACDLLRKHPNWALVTAPLNKAMLQAAGFTYAGHTEFLADRAGLGADDVCMHLCGPKLRVSLVTTHPPLRSVPDMITPERILRCLELTTSFVRRIGYGHLPIAVCGLNPHAGEGGTIGSEDLAIIEPAVAEAIRRGLNVTGPCSADTIFHFAATGIYSAVLAMYHDQGLGPLKLLHFHEAVNVTLGLPFIRTSVDHGTGYDLVGKNKASGKSLEAAIKLALELLSSEK